MNLAERREYLNVRIAQSKARIHDLDKQLEIVNLQRDIEKQNLAEMAGALATIVDMEKQAEAEAEDQDLP